MEKLQKYSLVFAVLYIVSIGLYGGSFQTLGPLSMGIELNSFTSQINKDKVYTGGRYFLGLGRSFVEFPTTYQTMELSNIVASTIEKEAITLQVSLLYRLQPRAVVALYGEWQENYHSFYASEAIQHVKQQAVLFELTEFYTHRELIEKTMKDDLTVFFATHLAELGYFQLLDIGFSLDSAIVDKFVKRQDTKTAVVVQDAEVIRKETLEIKSQLDAQVTVARAEASALGISRVASATAQGFSERALATANSLADLVKELHLDGSALLQYLWSNAMVRPDNRRVVVGFDGVLKDVVAQASSEN